VVSVAQGDVQGRRRGAAPAASAPADSAPARDDVLGRVGIESPREQEIEEGAEGVAGSDEAADAQAEGAYAEAVGVLGRADNE
jgi:hypothetical protein